MEKQQHPLFGINAFTTAFQQFDEETFFQQLENRVKPQSYYQKYKGFKTVILLLSYLFNAISAFTASYLVFWLTQWLTDMTVVSYGFSGVFLFFLEKLKRKSSSEFFQVYFFEKTIASGWLLLSLALFATSVTSTYFGTDQATVDFAPPPIIQQDSVLNDLYAQLDSTEKQISEARETRWKGTTTRTSQRTISELTLQKSGLITSITEREKGKDRKNHGIITSHQEQVTLTATTLAWITVVFEVLFEGCIAYIWYYYYRSYVERKKVAVINQQQHSSLIPPQAPPSPTLHQNGTSSHMQTNETFVSHSLAPISPIGFFTQKQREKLFKQQENVSKQNLLENQIIYQDIFTVAHTDFKTGKIRHVNLGNIENMIDIYTSRIEEAQQQDNKSALQNRLEKLHYWQSKRQELLKKISNTRQDVKA